MDKFVKSKLDGDNSGQTSEIILEKPSPSKQNLLGKREKPDFQIEDKPLSKKQALKGKLTSFNIFQAEQMDQAKRSNKQVDYK